MYLHIHKQDIVALFCTLDQLGTELGYKSGVPEARCMQSRVITVLQRVSDEGWSVLRPELDDVCIAMLGLQGRTTELHDAVQRLGCTSGTGYHLLLKQSQELVDLMGRRLATEKEIISLIDQGGVEAYDEAMFTDSLVWQTAPVDISHKS